MDSFKHILFDEVYAFGSINSTMSRSLKMIKEEQVTGNFLVVSQSQNSGRGRNANGWFSPDGGIYLSANLFGLNPDSTLTLFIGICIHKALLDCFPYLQKELQIKWPNDIYLDGLKLCGILSQHHPKYRYHSIGVGMNTNIEDFPENLKEIAISLSDCLHFQINNKKITSKIFDYFSEDFPEYVEKGLDFDYYNQYSLLKNYQVTIDTDFAKYTGLCKGINKSGAIILQLPSKLIQPFFAGSIIGWHPED